MSHRLNPLLALIASAALVGAAAPGAAGERPGTVSLELENDRFAGTDRHYTHGSRLSRVSAEDDVPSWAGALFDAMPFFGPPEARRRVAYTLGQSIFTPKDIARTTLDPDDRPYAGWLYGGAALIAYDDVTLDSLELIVGVVGPSAQAEDVQTAVHEAIDVTRPRGWDNQLDDEPGLMLAYEHRWRACLTAAGGDCRARPLRPFAIDITPHLGATVGNVMTYASIGAVVRLGDRLDAEFGPPSIRPGVPGWNLGRWGDGFDWHVFGGAELRAVARNIFLDGNTFSDSHSVSKTPLVGDLQIGLALTFPVLPLRLTYRHVFRTPEFSGQRGLDQFDALSVSVIF